MSDFDEEAERLRRIFHDRRTEYLAAVRDAPIVSAMIREPMTQAALEYALAADFAAIAKRISE